MPLTLSAREHAASKLWPHAAIVIVQAVCDVCDNGTSSVTERARVCVCMHVGAVFSILIGTNQWILYYVVFLESPNSCRACSRIPAADPGTIPVRVHRAVLSLTTSSQVQERPEISAVLLHANLALQVVLNRPPVRAVHGDVDGL